MSAPIDPKLAGVPGFRRNLMLAMMLVVAALTGVGLYIAERNLEAEVDRELQQRFETELAALNRVRQVRQSAIAELGRTLARKPRIHAALEDDAPDLLYPSARDELRAVMGALAGPVVAPLGRTLYASFCRFLDGHGAVIPPTNSMELGALTAAEAAGLALDRVPEEEQIGYLLRRGADGETAVEEMLAVPIISGETHQPIAALVVGFRSAEAMTERVGAEMRSGIWLGGRLHFPSLGGAAQEDLAGTVTRTLGTTVPQAARSRLVVELESRTHLLLFERLNPGSVYPAAYEICAFPLDDLLNRQRMLRWKILVAGAVMLVGGLTASQFLARRFALPVEQLEEDSAEHRLQRRRAEAALESTTAELQRSARFSADASHQLNTPVAVLRAGLEELLARHELTPEIREEVAALVHQTYRLGGVIQDLLLLSRMDAGRLQLEFTPVNLRLLVDGWLDDLSALPDAAEYEVETEVAGDLHVAGDPRYTTLILQNLLENARKYNRPGGRIRVAAREEDGRVVLTIGNTGSAIPPAMQEHVFDRFHRGAMGENVSGSGLGLNLCRELARLHGGDLRLARSEDGWTEFEVRFLAAPARDARLATGAFE